MTARQRDIRMLQLTSKELSELPSETKVYEGVGKMYVFSTPPFLQVLWLEICDIRSHIAAFLSCLLFHLCQILITRF